MLILFKSRFFLVLVKFKLSQDFNTEDQTVSTKKKITHALIDVEFNLTFS